MGEPDHLERVPVPLPAQAVRVDRLVEEDERVVDRVEVADRRMDVDRLDGVAAEEVDDVDHLAQPDQVLVVPPVPDPAAAVGVGDVRRAPHRAERDPVAAEMEVVDRVPRVERELRGGGGDPLHDEAAVQPDPLAVDPGARRLQEVPRLRVEEVHPDLLEDREGRLVDRLELVGGDDLHRAVAEPRLDGPALGRERAAGTVAGVAAAAAAPLGGALGRGGAGGRLDVGHRPSSPRDPATSS